MESLLTSVLGSRGPATSQLQISSMLDLVPFIFQLPPTKNLRDILFLKQLSVYLQALGIV